MTRSKRIAIELLCLFAAVGLVAITIAVGVSIKNGVGISAGVCFWIGYGYKSITDWLTREANHE